MSNVTNGNDQKEASQTSGNSPTTETLGSELLPTKSEAQVPPPVQTSQTEPTTTPEVTPVQITTPSDTSPNLLSLMSYEQPNPARPEKAFHGVVGEIVKAIEPHTEADPIAILTQLLVVVGNIVGRKAFFTAEADRHFPNLFAVIVGKTAKGRKGTSLGYARRIAQEIASDWAKDRIQTGLSSGEGLIAAVRNESPDKRLLVVETEFSSVLHMPKRDGNTLSARLREAWDTGNLQVMTRNDAVQATDAHISIIGHITEAELRESLSSREVFNGFANRFLWVAARRSRLLPEGGSLDWRTLEPSIGQLKDAVSSVNNVTEVKRDESARQLWLAEYERLSAGDEGTLGAITSRAEPQVMRLALLYALLDQSHVIKRAHLEAALDFWNYCEASAKLIFRDSADSSVAERIYKALRARFPNPLTRTDIRDLLSKNVQSDVIDEALESLRANGFAWVKREKTKGRPVEEWFYSVTKTT